MDNRANILHCALQLFSEKGYDAVGVQEVAEWSGITKPTLYHYFGSKLGLLKALLESYQADFNAKIQTASQYHGDLPISLETLARAYFQFAQENPAYYRMQLALYFAPPDSDGAVVTASLSRAQYQCVEEMFAAASKDHGNMRGRQALYAATFIGVLNTCIGLWLNHALTLEDDLLRRVVRQFQYGIYS